jgi:hypothetical protein
MTHGILDLDGQIHFGSPGPSGLLSTSHFKSPEAHFPEGLDQLPPVPFKINDSYSLRGLLFWRYTLCKFSLPNIHEPLIWTVPRIFVTERLKLSFCLCFNIETDCLRKLCFVFMVVTCMIKDLDDWLWAEKTGRPGHTRLGL